jgi:hypothetical protein
MRFYQLRKISKRKEVRRTKMLSLLRISCLKPLDSKPETTHFWQRNPKASEL